MAPRLLQRYRQGLALLNSTERRRSPIADPTGQVIVLRAPLPASQFKDEITGVFGSAGLKFADIWTVELEGRYAGAKSGPSRAARWRRARSRSSRRA